MASNLKELRPYSTVLLKSYLPNKIHPKQSNIFRNWAVFYALQGDKEKALQNLQKAIDSGYNDLDWLETDESINNLRKDELFISMIDKLKREAKDK